MKTIVKYYLRWPILFDSVIAFALCYYMMACVIEIEPRADRGNHLNLISSIVSTCISLAGFILAALTIVVTFKSNLKAKGITEADDALELILSSKHYDSIVSVFKTAIVEFVFVTVVLYLVSAANAQLTMSLLTIIIITSILITTFTIWRSLFILFRILRMEKRGGSEKRN